MEIILLSASSYIPYGPNYGDCILIDTGTDLIVFDCGCLEHAKRVEEYMAGKYTKAIVVLSHNDSDHFDGIPYLVEKGLVSQVHTHLFLKHLPEIKEILDDGRVTDNSLRERIKDAYDKIASLSKKVTLVDALDEIEIVPGVEIVGPSVEYALESIATAIDSRKGNHMDSETVFNAASIQISVACNTRKCLFCGDASFEAIKDILSSFSIIQLPHHGKAETANKIFEKKRGLNDTIYFVSDNTGNSNGGSDKLNTRGKDVRSTKHNDVHYHPSNSNTSCSRVLGSFR